MAKNVTRTIIFRPDPRAASPRSALTAALQEAKAKNCFSLLIHAPSDLGSTYEELLASLDAIASADLALMIVPSAHRQGVPYSTTSRP